MGATLAYAAALPNFCHGWGNMRICLKLQIQRELREVLMIFWNCT
jgi:hypothetical protein